MAVLTCRDVVAFLMDYLDESLEPLQRAEFEAHLAACDECVAYLRRYEQTTRLGRAAFEEPDAAAEAHVPRRLVEAILAARRGTPDGTG
jgi:anti-sigma factor RsiW